jgi:putative oxidoreductase
VQRLFSVFPEAWPGGGLLLLRVVSGGALIQFSGIAEAPTATFQIVVLPYIASATGILILVGLWTPIAAFLGVMGALWAALSRAGDVDTCVLLGGVCGALIMLGPGAWSIDARLFGRSRLDIHDSRR